MPAKHVHVIELVGGDGLEQGTSFVDHVPVRIRGDEPCIRGERLHGATDRPGEQWVVRIDHPDDLAGREPEALVDRAGLSDVVVRHGADSIPNSAEEVLRPICRAVVEHDVLDVRVVLVKNALNDLSEVVRPVVRGRDDRDEGFGTRHG
jgi:hypothetical protein